MRAARFAALSACALSVFGCGPAPEPTPPPTPTATPTSAPSAPPSASATAAATVAVTAAPTAPAAGTVRLSLILRAHWSQKAKGPLPTTIDVPAEWAVRKVSESITSLEPCAHHGILGGVRLHVQACAGKGEAACLEANTLPPDPTRTRIGPLEDLGPSRRFALARFKKGSGLVVVEGSAAAYDAETDQAAVCSFETFENDRTAHAAYSAVCRTLLLRTPGTTPADPVEKPASPGGFPARNPDSYPNGPKILEAALTFLTAAGKGDMAAARKVMLTGDACKTGTLFAGKAFTGSACTGEVKLAQGLLELFLKQLPAGFEPGPIAWITPQRDAQYNVEVHGTKAPCEKPQKVMVLELSNGFRVIPMPSIE